MPCKLLSECKSNISFSSLVKRRIIWTQLIEKGGKRDLKITTSVSRMNVTTCSAMFLDQIKVLKRNNYLNNMWALIFNTLYFLRRHVSASRQSLTHCKEMFNHFFCLIDWLALCIKPTCASLTIFRMLSHENPKPD